ncbi:MAG: two-component system response regulator [Lentisphaerae bacterium GWF2_52_8]|nr:MAG: two-component system response regulator [Lentisphaerae bacterium GWF2_52_8]
MSSSVPGQSLYPEKPILVVDDEPHALRSIEITLVSAGFNNLILCEDSREVLIIMEKQDARIVLLDMVMPHKGGKELLPEIIASYPDATVIMATAVNEIETAVSCMREGARDYLLKPLTRDRLVGSIRNALEIRALHDEIDILRDTILSDSHEQDSAFSGIVTCHPKMHAVFSYCVAVAPTRNPVLITGETGTGKELVAKALHKLSGREGDFVAVNVAGLNEQLFADTLFGHVRGAFTGADRERAGLVEKASGGTLFLDEIGDLCPASQVKLLRLLQENEYTPLGSDSPQRTNIRVIAATHKELSSLIDLDGFRKDLYYRLATHHVELPPLRKRKEDLPLLLDHFIADAAVALKKPAPKYRSELLTLLLSYQFPGNIRELKSMVEDAVANQQRRSLPLETFKKRMSGMGTARGNLPEALLPGKKASISSWIASMEELPPLKEMSSLLIEEALTRSKGSQTAAARLLGITQQALSYRLKK